MPGNVVFVTGGSRGIGMDIVRAILAGGYEVVAISRTKTQALEKLAENAEGRLSFLAADLTTATGREAAAIRLRSCRGLYGLVNNAGYAAAALHVTMSQAHAARMWSLNTEAPMWLCQAAVKSMYRSGCGRIVNITSVSTHRTFRGLGAYTATKCAVEGFSRVLAAEVGQLGITVNCVAPGFIDTMMTSTVPEALRQTILKRGTLTQQAAGNDVADLVSYLLSPAAAAITAQVLRVDAGASA